MDGAMTKCPICGTPQKANPRYPHYVCRECAADVRDEEGAALAIDNANSVDGISVTYRASGEERESRVCFIRGFRCVARQAHFGGVVLQVADE